MAEQRSALRVELVSVEREIWRGEAREVIARTTEGDLGILPGHAPLLGAVVEGGLVRILQESGEVAVAVHGGFLSVTDRGVTILAEIAELGPDIDASRAQAALDRATSSGDEAAARRAQSRLAAAGHSAPS